MIVIFNSDGSINDTDFSDYVQQGSNGANMLQIAYADSEREGLSAYLIALRPNGTAVTLPAHEASFDCNGEHYEGWEVTITGSFTLYAGAVHCTVDVVDGEEQIQANYPFDVVVNPTGNPIDGEWDEQINVAQYNSYMAQLSDKAAVKRVAGVDSLPRPGQRNAIYLVGDGAYYDAYVWDPDLNGYRILGNQSKDGLGRVIHETYETKDEAAELLAEAKSYADGHGDKSYSYHNDQGQDTWVIDHNLGKKPSVTIVADADDKEVIADIEYVNENRVIIHFQGALNGSAYLN